MSILDTLVEYHHNPQLLATQDLIPDRELNLAILGKLLEEDDDSWFIKHQGVLLFYCRKYPVKLTSTTMMVGQNALKLGLQELWGRYTAKEMLPVVYQGYKV